MSSDNTDLSTGQIMALSALLVAIPFAIIIFVRWVFTSKVGAVVGFIVAILIMITVMSNPTNHERASVPVADPIESAATDLERAVRDITSRTQPAPQQNR